MAKMLQFYDGEGVSLRIDRDNEAPVRAWHSQRNRLRAWLDSVPDSQWDSPTRCDLWDMTTLARHLVTASQLLAHTLHMASKGISTDVMRGFDTRQSVQDLLARLGNMRPHTVRQSLASEDISIESELADLGDHDWSAMAETPAGRTPAHMTVNHFLFDSWVHEYDFMVPRGQCPTMDRFEAEVVVSYLVGLASIETGSATPLDIRLTSPEIRIGLAVKSGTTHVTAASVPNRAAVIEGRAVDVVDRASGREARPVRGDRDALAVLDGFGQLLAN